MRRRSIFDKIRQVLFFTSANVKPDPKPENAYTILHSEKIEDPYRWINTHPNKRDRYAKEENRYASFYFSKHQKFAADVVSYFKRYTTSQDATVSNNKEIFGNFEYFFKDDGNLHRKKVNGSSPFEELVIKRAIESSNKIIYNIGEIKISPSEKWIAYLADITGTNNFDCYLNIIDKGIPIFKTVIENVSSLEWLSPSVLCYTIKDKCQNRANEAYKYNIDNDTSELLYRETDQNFFLHLSKSKSGKYIFINITSKIASEVIAINCVDFTQNIIWSRKLNKDSFIDHQKGRFYNLTEYDNNYCIKVISENELSHGESWKLFYEHNDDETFIIDLALYDNILAIIETVKIIPTIKFISFDGELLTSIKPFDTPGIVELDHQIINNLLNITFTSPIQSPIKYNYNFISNSLERVTKSDFFKSHETLLFKTNEKIWGKSKFGAIKQTKHCYTLENAESHDGVQIPITIFYGKNIDLKKSPMICHVYGSYGASVNMSFNRVDAYLLHHGWILCYLHPRGGGEKGKQWYHAGRLLNKENTFKDLEASLLKLHELGYSSPNQTGLVGKSAGALPAAVMLNRNQDLIGCVVLQAPFINVLHTMIDDSSPLVTQELLEYGNPRMCKEAFYYIKNYCPYINMKHIYKPVFLTSSINDDRVPCSLVLQWLAKQRNIKEPFINDPFDIIARIHQDGGHYRLDKESEKEDAEVVTFLHNSLMPP